MGFYIRKSVSLGPLRFNLSKSGIGVSAGVRGFRFGSGPRGNYVHMGRQGLYYRHTLPALRPRNLSPAQSRFGTSDDQDATHGPLGEIASGPVSAMVDSSSAKLLTELNEKSKKFNLWPITFCAAFLVAGALNGAGMPRWLTAPVAILGLGFTFAIHTRDKLANSVVVMYDLDDDLCNTFRNIFSTTMSLTKCGATWHVTAQGQVYDRKYHAGANSLIRRTRFSVVERTPRRVKSNISIVCVPLGRGSLFLLPDVILFSKAGGFGAIAYSDLNIAISDTNFIEDGSVPHDAQVVGRTWRYVNKDGGPDRRFNNNRELPICKYEEVRFSSSTGLNELIQISRAGYGQLLQTSISAMSQAIERLHKIDAKRIDAESNHHQLEQRQTTQRSRDGGSNTASTLGQEEIRSTDVVFQALLEILCSVMVADGRASKSERACIVDLMRKVKSNMKDDEVERRIDHYIGAISSHGYQHVVAQTLAKVSIFKRIGKQDVLLRCIDVVVAADSKIDAREKALCDRIRHLANT
jgi:hypothetical protein